ncbi:MAG: preprotein translocase subunit SecG [Desulfomonilaceae bacterium]
MLTAIILIVHVIVCIALILIILLQTGKGADIGAVFGGGSSQTVFGSTGAATFLSKFTIGAAVIFMITSIVLTYYSGRVSTIDERSLMTEQKLPVGTQSMPASQKQTPAKEQGSTAQPADKGTAPVENSQAGNAGTK